MFAGNYIFATPLWLLALLLLPLAIWLRRRRRVPVLVVPFAAAWHQPSLTSPSRLPLIFAGLGLVLLTLGLARPQRLDQRQVVNTEGYDLILAVDLSGSMLAEDYEVNGRPANRLQAIKPVIQAFITERPGDRIGIVVFSGRAYTLAPLTFDHAWLGKQIERLKIGLIEDGTAIGDGLGVALSRLEQAARTDDGKRAGAFVVLLTDGSNNRGAMAPIAAAEIAQKRAIPVYTIGAGRNGIVPMPVFDQAGNRLGTRRVQSDLDETTLHRIAELTDGQYFRAADADTVQRAFAAIDENEKIEFEAKSTLITNEYFPWFTLPGAACLLLAALAVRPQSAAA
ncbi:MAG: VWA domain-containing protein [Verrucomicrobiota bacterium]